MQPAPAPQETILKKKFFLLGMVFELVLILLCYFLPDGVFSVEIRNFAIVTHYPFLLIAEEFRIESALAATLVFLALFPVISSIWGFLIWLITRWARRVSKRISPRQMKVVQLGLCVLALVLLAMATISIEPQESRPFAASPEVKSVVEGNTLFALDLYHKVKEQPGNLFFSPYSISSSLAMTSVGARGQTESEMTRALHLNLSPEKLHPAFKALGARMDRIQRWNRVALKSANSLWCQKEYAFKETFLQSIQENYAAEARPVDFKNGARTADEINAWIDANTNHKVQGGIGSGQLTPDTQMALCNAIYFKAKWLHQFDKKNTQPSPFYVTTNETVTVPMMNQRGGFKHAVILDDSLELVELPYSGNDLSMVILLPVRLNNVDEAEPNDVHTLEKKLTGENLRLWLATLDKGDPHDTRVSLPNFATKCSLNLANDLKALGITSAFGGKSDFSGMDGTTNLFLSDVFHKAFVEVNETGTEAAAITLKTVKSRSMAGHCVVDHPFIFLIRENGSGSILFLGRILNPMK